VDSGHSLEGLFIGKIDSAKLCTLRLRESIRNQGIGRVLVAEGLRHLLRSESSRFHVTISEGAEEGCIPLFESIGFRRIAVERNRYLPGVDEFVYSCGKDEIVEAVNNELSFGMERTLFGALPRQMPNENTLLMSLKPEFAELILKGHKTVEFRRKFSKKYQGATIVFYITRPVKQFMFTATIAQVDHQQKARLWETHKHHGGISEDLFDRYFSGTEFGYAIQLSNIQNIPNQLGLERAQQIYPRLRPPQSFQRLERSSPLMRALALPISV
jgi:predicted transcriptional regulator